MSSLPVVDEDTLADLEWERVVDAVVGRCRGPRAKVRALPLAQSREEARVGLAETAEAMRLDAEGEPLPREGLLDLREPIARASRMGHLDGPALRDLSRVLGAARSLRRFLSARKERAPALAQACALDPGLDTLEDELRAHVDADGTLADHASPELRRLRTETANLRARIVGRLEELIHKHAVLLSDSFYTERDGRYVLPVRSDTHERLPGIVHGSSASGATVFVEPESVIVHGNRLKIAEGEKEREEARILALLTDLVRERLPSLVAALDALDHADLRAAMARFGLEHGGHVVELDTLPRLVLPEARHPVLAIDGVAVVPNDLTLVGGEALVISGPNAGGKTVALKILGLAALMMRAGLPLLAGEDSRVGFFRTIRSDVGDDQSLTKNLSTFSAHVRRLTDILEVADTSSLVLLDELAGGTDPDEGAALACAVVDALCRRGAATAVTTHYDALKALAARDERLRNASVGFDVARMEPTFTVTMDLPGASSALLVARRFGMPAAVVEYAESVLPEHTKSFNELVRKMEERTSATAALMATAREEVSRARAAREAAEARLEALSRTDRDRIERETQKLLVSVQRAREELREARRAIRAARDEASLEQARRSVEALAERARVRVEADAAVPPVAPIDLAIGARVFSTRLAREVEVLERLDEGRVRVAAGALKMIAPVEELRAAAPPPSPRVGPPRALASPPPARPFATRDNTLDLRGMRVDDAVTMTEAFLDRMYGASEGFAFLLHGVGTGALRDGVRALLERSDRYVRSFRPGNADEGGPKVTVVELR